MFTFLADIDWRGLADMILPIIAVTFAMTIPIVAMIVGHLQKKEKMRLAEKAIEHGVDISDMKFDEECQPAVRLPYRAGMVNVAVGLALAVTAYLELMDGFPGTLVPIAASICFFVGVALLINDWINREKLGG